MPQKAWSPNRERQYEHIRESQEERGVPERTAKQIAARTVNKERARAGDRVKPAVRRPTTFLHAGAGGLRSHHGKGGRTRDQLYQEAKRRGIRGHSTRSKRQLEDAVGR
jgi:hypothetical protein